MVPKQKYIENIIEEYGDMVEVNRGLYIDNNLFSISTCQFSFFIVEY